MAVERLYRDRFLPRRLSGHLQRLQGRVLINPAHQMSAVGGIVLQNSANERSVPKMGNIGIEMAGFLNQNSPFRTCFRKVFFASGRKKVLQQISAEKQTWPGQFCMSLIEPVSDIMGGFREVFWVPLVL